MRKNVELNVMKKNLSIHVDADACPVKEEILHCAKFAEWRLFLLLHTKI